jgi:GTP-binding protein YchF
MIFTIFGYPKTGKTLLFNLLTDKQEEVSKFSVSSHKYHTAIVDVPDARLAKLGESLNLPPIYAKIEYLDAGPISYGEVKNSTFIDLLRRADGLVHIVRGFHDPEIIHACGSVDPRRDIKNMEEELLLVDLISIEKRLDRINADLKKMQSRELTDEHELLGKLKNTLESGRPLREYPITPVEDHIIKGYKFLTIKPLINIINTDENSYSDWVDFERDPQNEMVGMTFCGQIEKELLELEAAERILFQKEYGLEHYVYIRESFIKTSYKSMDLISFFTVGKEETKAWTIPAGTTAYDAAEKIHTDIQQGFIRAEIIGIDDFLSAGGFPQAREKGLIRIEGKTYIIRDGEIVQFRFNK